MTKLSILILLICIFPYLAAAVDPYANFSQINLPDRVSAPLAIAFGPNDEGPYVGVTDGRILKYQGPGVGFVDFATTSTRRTKELCDGVKNLSLAETCGRPLAFSFDNSKKLLYIADAFLGIYVVGQNGGPATFLFDTAEGVRMKLASGIDVNPVTGDVYVTDGSQTVDLRNVTDPVSVGDSTGRLIKYNPRTKEVTVLLKGLAMPIGPAVSSDGTFVVFSERNLKRVTKYALVGIQRNRAEGLLYLPGYPSIIKRAATFNEFWVAVNIGSQLQPSFTTPYGFRFNSFGVTMERKNFQGQYVNVSVGLVQEYLRPRKSLYIGSGDEVSFVGIYSTNF